VTREECVNLTRYVGEICPQQKIGNLTGLAWHDVIGHLDFAEAKKAAAAISARQPFVAPSEIIAEVAAARSVYRPHSNACRAKDHGDCRVTWCSCTCHPDAVAALTSQEAPRPALSKAQRDSGPRQLGMGDLPVRRQR
jgi:hypothetical protein